MGNLAFMLVRYWKKTQTECFFIAVLRYAAGACGGVPVFTDPDGL